MLANELFHAMAAAADRPIFGCEGEDWTGRRCLTYVGERRAQMLDAGIIAGDRVMVANLRGNAYWLDHFALWSIGAIGVPTERTAPASRLDEVVEDVDPGFLCGRLENGAGSAADTVIILPALSEAAGVGNDDVSADLLQRDPFEANCLALYTFTSGTTKRPKVVPLSHGMLLANARASASQLPYDENERVFAPIPFRFISAISHCLVTVLQKATYLGSETPLIKGDMVSTMQDWQSTAFGGSPLQVRWIAETGDDTDVNFELNWIMSSGDNLPIDIIDRLVVQMPNSKVIVAYGLTEVAGRFCMLDPDLLKKRRGSVGRPIHGMRLSVRNEDDRPCEPGEIGNVFASGGGVFDGYLNFPEENSQVMTPHGFLTGDLGIIDEDGYLYLRGRSDEVFKSAGQKVSALLIAQELIKLGIFTDVAVTDQPHPILERVPHVYYVPKDGVEFKKGEILRSLRKTLPSNHIPQGFTAVDRIPRTGSGKLDRRGFKELLRSLS